MDYSCIFKYMLIRKNIWDLSNCQKPIKGKVTIAGSLPEYCYTFSGWVGLSHKLLVSIFPLLLLSFSYLLEDGQRSFIGFDGLGSDLTQLSCARTNICPSWSCQFTAPWKDGLLSSACAPMGLMRIFLQLSLRYKHYVPLIACLSWT